MRFGAYIYGDPRTTAVQSRALERNGFTNIWLGEVPTWGFGDAFQGMHAAALATDSIGVGTAITVAGIRPPAYLVSQLGTLNAAAPGRVTVGMGTGALARKVIGLAPLRFNDFRAEVEQVRQLLDGGTTTVNGQPIAFREPLGGIRLDPPIRLVVAAGGPKAAALAGEFGDGLLATGVFDRSQLERLRGWAEAAARAAGRDPQALTFGVEAGPVCIVGDGESFASPRVLDVVEPFVTMYFVLSAVLGTTPDEIPAAAADAYRGFLADVESAYGVAAETRLLFDLGSTAYVRQPRNDRWLTPEVITALTLTGPHGELRDRIADMAAAGVTDLAVLRAKSYEWRDGPDLDALVRLMGAV
jgi:5,10-methylenetetrahydromethanopterin reductase